MIKENLGSLSVGVIVIIALVGVAIAGAGFGVYKYQALVTEKDNIAKELATERGEDVTSTGEPTLEEEGAVESSIENVSAPTNYVPPPTTAPAVTTLPPSAIPAAGDFTARCKVTADRIGLSRTTFAEINLLDEQHSKYNFEWSRPYLTQSDGSEARYEVNVVGAINLFATVTRLSDGYSKVVLCPITVFCDGYECLSINDKKDFKLDQIVAEVDRWYDETTAYNSTADICSESESIIRAYEYEYELLGGTGVPGFTPDVDCASDAAPLIYKYKIVNLIN